MSLAFGQSLIRGRIELFRAGDVMQQDSRHIQIVLVFGVVAAPSQR
jgi:hypothetical protein